MALLNEVGAQQSNEDVDGGVSFQNWRGGGRVAEEEAKSRRASKIF
jgi:hypothetical protein